MKKLFLAVTAFTLLSVAVQAQSKQQGVTFGIGPNFHLPLGDFGKAYSFGIGGTVQVEFPLADNIKGVGSAGYTSFIGKSQTFDFGAGPETFKNPSVGLIPVLIGARFYPSEQFFIGAQIGVGFLSGSGSSTSAFDYYPQIGYDASMLQFILGYNGLSKSGQTNSSLALTVLYKFGGGN